MSDDTRNAMKNKNINPLLLSLVIIYIHTLSALYAYVSLRRPTPRAGG